LVLASSPLAQKSLIAYHSILSVQLDCIEHCGAFAFLSSTFASSSASKSASAVPVKRSAELCFVPEKTSSRDCWSKMAESSIRRPGELLVINTETSSIALTATFIGKRLRLSICGRARSREFLLQLRLPFLNHIARQHRSIRPKDLILHLSLVTVDRQDCLGHPHVLFQLSEDGQWTKLPTKPLLQPWLDPTEFCP